MEVIGSKSSIALRTFPLSCVIACLQAFVTEDMETLCKHSLLIPGITTGATQLSLRTKKKLKVSNNTVSIKNKYNLIFYLVNTTEYLCILSFFYLILINFFLQDLICIRIHLHLLLFLQLTAES